MVARPERAPAHLFSAGVNFNIFSLSPPLSLILSFFAPFFFADPTISDFRYSRLSQKLA